MTKTILVVDERWDVRTTLKTLLTKNGYRVIVARGNGECLEKLKKSKPDLLLIGYVTTRGRILDFVKKTKKFKKLRVVYLITDESEEEHLELYANVVGFLRGSDNINVFLKKIKEVLK